MFRLTHFIDELRNPTPVGPRRDPPGPIVIWNLIRRCNLKCMHCYSISGDVDFPGELTTDEVFRVMDDLKAARVPGLILSGGEPLLRPDIFAIGRRAKEMGFYTALSSNGTLMDDARARDIAAIDFDYVGVSLDGIGAVHDKFRGQEGAFDRAIEGLRRCRALGVKTGVRFTMTVENHALLPDLLKLVADEGIDKFYLSHLVYAGRGNKNRGSDADWDITRRVMAMLFETAWESRARGETREYVTGNNDADGVFLYLWAKEKFPERAEHLRAKLVQWGGNSSGVNVANIDNLGNVHPDTMWWHHTLGNIRERKFGDIWSDVSDPIMAGLKQRPRTISGRCGACRHFDICGGNTRVRAQRLTGDAFAEDPACYLTDVEIGAAASERVLLRPFRGAKHEVTM